MGTLYRVSFLMFGLMVVQAFAIDDMVCARNYMVGDKDSPCHRKATGYEFVLHLDTPEIRVCARASIGKYCAEAPLEYRWVKTEAGGDVCITDFNQPTVANFCQDLPALYSYVQPIDP